jgi:hypothetical protein
MATSFSQDDVFPLIRRIIHSIYQITQDYVRHDEIVQELFNSQASINEIIQAQKLRPHETAEQIAGNMVAWFSQRITVGMSSYTNEFDRKKIRGKWAYRPRRVQQASSIDDLLRKKREQDFDRAIHHRYASEIPTTTGYRPSRMVEMIDRYGGLGTIRRLMVQYADYASEGYTRLWEHNRLDLSFEALMHDSRFVALFTDEERRWAYERLAQYDYTPPQSSLNRQ